MPPSRRDALAWYSMARRTRRGIVAIASGCAAAIVVLALLNGIQAHRAQPDPTFSFRV